MCVKRARWCERDDGRAGSGERRIGERGESHAGARKTGRTSVRARRREGNTSERMHTQIAAQCLYLRLCYAPLSELSSEIRNGCQRAT